MTHEAGNPERTFYTTEGLRLRTISPEEFHEDWPHALTPLQIEEDVVYEARGWSRRLESAKAAVSFNVMATQLDAIHPNLATRSFILLTLDDDFNVVSSHKSVIRNDRLVENAPISIQPQQRLPDGARILRSYLVSNNDTTFDSIVNTRASIDAQIHGAQLSSV